MDSKANKRELEQQLARCRRLMSEFRDGVTAYNLDELERELGQRLRDLAD